MRIKLYVEGGGDSKDLKTRCRRGFRKFLQKAGLGGQMPRIVACGGREQAYDSFKTALEDADTIPMLLVDSEDPVTAASPWEHLRNRPGDKWDRPGGAHEDHCHLMVQVMESWFLADKPSLKAFFGTGFREGALPANPNIEQIPKKDVLRGVVRATEAATKKGYSKGSHSFEVLSRLDPAAVEAAAPHAKRFFATLRAGGPGTR